MMRDRLTLLFAIVLLAAVTATSYWYATVLRRPTAGPVARPGTPDFEAARLVITQFDAQGRPRHRLYAESLRHFGDSDDLELTQPRLVSLRPDRARVEVAARLARVENAGERVHLIGEVVITRAAEGPAPMMRATSEYLLALPDHDRYQTDRPVQVERGAARISAERGMQIDNIARTAQFDGNVRIQLPPAGRP